MRGWLDATLYETLISPSVQLNDTIMKFNLTVTQYFRYKTNCNTDCIIDDVSFHLKSPYPYFHLTSKAPIILNFLDDQETFETIMMESVELLSTINGHIPLNNYEMKIEVTDGNSSLLSSDIIIHVVEPLPSVPVPGQSSMLLHGII